MTLRSMSLCPVPTAPPVADERPPREGGWYWNNNRLARTWLPLIGLDGLGLLDYYLATADYRPGPWRGWAAVTLDELTRLTGWGRARVIRLNRLLAAAGLLEVCYRPVAGHGPAARRALYRVRRSAAPPAGRAAVSCPDRRGAGVAGRGTRSGLAGEPIRRQ